MRECDKLDCLENYNGECIRSLFVEDSRWYLTSWNKKKCFQYMAEYDIDETDMDWLEDSEIGIAFPLGPSGGNVTHAINPYVNFKSHYPDITEEQFSLLKQLKQISKSPLERWSDLKEKGPA